MKQWVKWVITISIIIGFSIGAYLLLDTIGMDGIKNVVDDSGVWGWLVFLLIQIIVTTLLCFIPASSMGMITLGIALFGPTKAILICGLGVFLSSMLMFIIGHSGGEALAKKLVGEDSLKKAQELIDVKSKMLLPLMFLFPIFPDDALCVVAGMTKMKIWYFALIAIIFRTIGVITICLGFEFIDWASMGVTDYILLINVFAIDIFFIFKSQHKIEKWINKKFRKGVKDEFDTNRK